MIRSENTLMQVIFRTNHTHIRVFLSWGQITIFTNMKIWCLTNMVQLRGIRTNDWNALA